MMMITMAVWRTCFEVKGQDGFSFQRRSCYWVLYDGTRLFFHAEIWSHWMAKVDTLKHASSTFEINSLNLFERWFHNDPV